MLTQINKNKILESIKVLEITYQELNVSHINFSYRKKAIIHHPDKGGDKETFNKILESKEILENFLNN